MAEAGGKLTISVAERTNEKKADLAACLLQRPGIGVLKQNGLLCAVLFVDYKKSARLFLKENDLYHKLFLETALLLSYFVEVCTSLNNKM
ncbi:hypothetical protein [Erwinia sp.]|uniref:hypothetical protein n=1 Tax=Erwinia citreus TaxID=558 RepID=UPI003C714B59